MRWVSPVVAMVWMLAGHAAVASPPRWSVTPPAGWTDESSAALQRPQVQAQQKTMATSGGGLEVAEFHGPDGNVLSVVFIHAPNEGEGGSGVDGFERGAHDGVAALGADKSYARREDGNTLVVDQVVTGAKGDVYLKRMAGATGAQLLGLSATCIAPEAVCAGALQSMTIDRSDFMPLHGRSRSSAYQRGEQVGRIAAIVAVVVLGLWLLRRSRKKRATP
jgi:hypothetical protein